MTALQNPIVKSALAGLVTAIGVDYHVWMSSADYSSTFNWRLALKRWVGGAVAGAATAAGLGSL